MVRGRSWGLVCIALSLAACTAQRGASLPPASYDSLAPSTLTSLDYEISTLSEQTPMLGDLDLLRAFPERLDVSLAKAFPAAQPGIGRSPLHLAVSCDVRERIGPWRFLRNVLSTLTLTLIPDAQEVELTLRVERSWNGEHTGTYEYTEKMTVSAWLFLLPLALAGKDRPHEVASSVIDDMLTHLVSDLRADLEARP